MPFFALNSNRLFDCIITTKEKNRLFLQIQKKEENKASYFVVGDTRIGLTHFTSHDIAGVGEVL